MAIIDGDDNPNILNGTSGRRHDQWLRRRRCSPGRGGNDLLRGGAGADTLHGGDGGDTASYFFGASGVTVDLVFGTGTGGEAQGDTLIGIEGVTGSTAGGDTLTGDGEGQSSLPAGPATMRYAAGPGTSCAKAGPVPTPSTAERVWTGRSYFPEERGDDGRSHPRDRDGPRALIDTLIGIENVRGSRVRHDVLIGNSGEQRPAGLGMAPICSAAGPAPTHLEASRYRGRRQRL